MDDGGSLENCCSEGSGPWVRILLPPPLRTRLKILDFRFWNADLRNGVLLKKIPYIQNPQSKT